MVGTLSLGHYICPMSGPFVETPLMKQYNAIKAKYPGALLLFRVGDFYETFGEDAIKASKILDIVLTKRGNGSVSETALAGFPHHSLDTYLPKLVRASHRVAICDQLEDPVQSPHREIACLTTVPTNKKAVAVVPLTSKNHLNECAWVVGVSCTFDE